MAELSFSLKDLHEVDRVCEELDPETHPLTSFHVQRVRDLAERLDLLTFMRRCIRGELMVGLAARAMGDALIQRGFASPGAVRGWISEDWDARYRPIGVRDPMLSHNLGRAGDEYIYALSTMNKWFGHTEPGPYEAFYQLLDVAHVEMFGPSELEVLSDESEDWERS